MILHFPCFRPLSLKNSGSQAHSALPAVSNAVLPRANDSHRGDVRAGRGFQPVPLSLGKLHVC